MMPGQSIKITLIGGPTALLEFGGLRFITDPTFDAGGGEYHLGAVTLKKRLSPAIQAHEVGPVDAVLLSHDQHSDNLDASGSAFIRGIKTVLTTPEGAGRLGGNARGLSVWETISMDSPDGRPVRITATPCRHGPAGIESIAGEVTGFMLEAQDGNCGPVYVTGDTVYFEGVAETARRFSPELILAFAGAARTRGPFDLTMSAGDLLDTAHAFPRALIVPVHTEGWEHFTQSAEDLETAFTALKIRDRLKIILPGETFVYNKAG
jgi:L-ascorbate metabolism protein UlaG (beta-lactamase superfamily)